MEVEPPIPWALDQPDRGARFRGVLRGAVGLGMVAGGFEAVGIAGTSQLALPFDEALVLFLVSVTMGLVLGLGLGAVLGGIGVLRLRPGSDGTAWTAWILGCVAGGLAAWHVWPAGWILAIDQGRIPASLAFFAAPLGLIGVVALNARFFIRRAERRAEEDLPPGLGWVPRAVGFSVLLALIGAFTASGRTFGTAKALETDASVLLITIDTLRRDHVSIYGENQAQTPVFDELASRGVVFDNAITPLPETAPAHAAMFTGRHPIRTGVLSNGHQLARKHQTLAEVLADEGYATGAFVSSFAVDSRTGLDQGFQAYDDDFFPWVRGLAEIRLARLGLRGVMRFGDPMRFRPLLERDAEETSGRAIRWLRDLGQRPFFLWVHLFEPHAPYESHGDEESTVDHPSILADEDAVTYDPELVAELRRLYAGEVEHTDRVLGDFLDRVEEVVDRPMTIIVTSDHGEMLGEHGVNFNHHGIWDETIRVPLVIVPHAGEITEPRVGAQVRLMDLPNTVLGLLRMDKLEGTESGDLMRFAQGLSTRDFASLLVGRTNRSLSGGGLYGYRAARQDAEEPGEMIKYIWNPEAGTEQLFDLNVDAAESTDLGPEQAPVLKTLRALVEREVGTIGANDLSDLDADTRDALRALGYVD